MTRYEPHCDCLGGHVTMLPDPNGRWCRATDPRAVADDPSGIVQQMPETVGGDALKPCPFCGQPAEWEKGEYGDGYPWNYIACSSCEAMGPATPRDLWSRSQAIAAWNRRATEADLLAEVERLKYALAQAAVPLEGLTLAAHMSQSDLGLCKGTWGEINNAVAHIRAALSPETDGGQDGA